MSRSRLLHLKLRRKAITWALASVAALLILPNPLPPETSEMQAQQPVVSAPLISGPAPRIDGRLDDPAWQNSGEAFPFVLLGKHSLAPAATRALVTFDSRNIYLGFICAEPRMDRLVLRETKRDGEVWKDDCVEVFLSPKRGAKYHHLIVSAAGVQYDEIGRAAPDSWNAKWRCEVLREADKWTAEISLPFAQMEVDAPRPGAIWNVNFCRHRPGAMEFSCFAPCSETFHEAENFARTVFSEEQAPVARFESPGELFLGAQEARVWWRNRRPRPSRLSAAAFIDDSRQQPSEQKLPPGSEGSISVPYRLLEEGEHRLVVEATDVGRGELIYRSPPIAFVVPSHGARLARLDALAARTLDRCRRPASREALENLRREIGRLRSLARRRSTWAAGNRQEWDRLGQMTDSTERKLYRERYRALAEHPEVGYAVGVESPLRKVLRDLPFDGKLGEPVHLSACRGEREPAQVILLALEQDLRDVEIEATDLRGRGGARIGKENISLNLVGWVKTRTPEYPVDYVGWYPDPLLDLKPFDVPADSLQPIWVTVHVPDDAPAGLYEGAIIIAPRNLPGTSVPLTVEVWDFNLPVATRLKTAFALHEKEIQDWYGWAEVPEELRSQWYRFLLEHRVNPTNIYSRSPAPEFEHMAECVANGMNAFNLAYIGPMNSEKELQDLAEFLRGYAQRLRERGWFSPAYVYGFDEVQPEGYEALRQAYSLIKRTVPDLPRVCTVAPTPELFGYVDVWAPLTAKYRHEEAAQRSRQGEEVWWYICLDPKHPYANWFIDYPAIEPRLLFWTTWKYGVSGFLYYSLNSWTSNAMAEGLPDCFVPHEDANALEAMRQGKRWPEVPWNTLTYSHHNGDGQLLYPGPDGKLLSSVRFECIRDGIEDYDYFWLLDSLTRKLSRRQYGKSRELVQRSRSLLQVDSSVVKSLTEFTHDPDELYSARRKVADQIVRVRRALEEGED
jgi:hypothetical protein